MVYVNFETTSARRLITPYTSNDVGEILVRTVLRLTPAQQRELRFLWDYAFAAALCIYARGKGGGEANGATDDKDVSCPIVAFVTDGVAEIRRIVGTGGGGVSKAGPGEAGRDGTGARDKSGRALRIMLVLVNICFCEYKLIRMKRR